MRLRCLVRNRGTSRRNTLRAVCDCIASRLSTIGRVASRTRNSCSCFEWSGCPPCPSGALPVSWSSFLLTSSLFFFDSNGQTWAHIVARNRDSGSQLNTSTFVVITGDISGLRQNGNYRRPGHTGWVGSGCLSDTFDSVGCEIDSLLHKCLFVRRVCTPVRILGRRAGRNQGRGVIRRS